MPADTPPPRADYLRAAFLNAGNAAGLALAAAATLATGDWRVAAVGVVAEVAWLVVGRRSSPVRAAEDRRVRGETRQLDARRLAEDVARLPTEDRLRVEKLRARIAELRFEASRNHSISQGFLDDELRRLDDVLADYTRLVIARARAAGHLLRNDAATLRAEVARHAGAGTDDTTRALARKNAELLEQRLALNTDAAAFVARADAQLSVVENAVAVLRGQVVTLQTRSELTQRLDEVMSDVDALRTALLEAGGPASSEGIEPESRRAEPLTNR